MGWWGREGVYVGVKVGVESRGGKEVGGGEE